MFTCCAPSKEVVEEVAAKEIPAVKALQTPRRRPCKVTITSARGLRTADFGGKSDPYVTCEVRGRIGSRVQTEVVSNSYFPVWDFEAELTSFMTGDSLLFCVSDKDLVGNDLLGTATFPYNSFEASGFSGEVALDAAGGAKAYLKVAISGADGKYPTAPAPADAFVVSLDGSPVGLELDALDKKFARVQKVQAGGKVDGYNKRVPAELQVREGDFICCCNGVFGNKIVGKIKEGGPLELTIRRSETLPVVLEPKGALLGIDLKYEPGKSAPTDLLINTLVPGSVSATSGVLFLGDRIVAAPGVPRGSTAKKLEASLKKSKKQAKVELQVLRVKPCPSSAPVGLSVLTRMAKDDLGLLPQPPEPKAKTALVQIYVRSQPFGGSDKSSSGHRYDSVPIANGMINAGMSCQLIHYVHEEHDAFLGVCKEFQALVVRCNPGQIKADGGDQARFDNGMRELRKLGVQVWPSPDVTELMGAKDALVKVAALSIGLEDTLAYYSEKDFAEGFKKTVAFQPRVIKQNRGSSGEGIWIVKLKRADYCLTYGARSCVDSDVLSLMEANDNHAEEHTVAEFIEFCVNGRTGKSGTWTSKGLGMYLQGGKEAGGQIVDQRFCPRIVEGELRYNMAGDALVGIIHKKPKAGGISAVSGTGSTYTYYGPEEPLFAALTTNFLKRDMGKIMPCLGLEKEPIPLWWTTDFINASLPGTARADEKWIVGEFNCSCVGISKCLAAYCHAEAPSANYCDIPPEDRAEAKMLGDLMGVKALAILSK